MVNENRFGVTSYCKCCAWKIDSIHNMRKNGTTKKEDWVDRPLHKDCWMLIKKFMSIHYGDATPQKYIRYNSKCYNDRYNAVNVLAFFYTNEILCKQYVEDIKPSKKKNYLIS